MKYKTCADNKMHKICRSGISCLICGQTFNCFHNYRIDFTWFMLATFMILAVFKAQSKATTKPNIKLNNRPIIGILVQESTDLRKAFPNENYTSYIAASYVKGVEAARARVVPIMIGKDLDYYKSIISKLNGVLMPGGSANLSRSAVDGYADAGEHIYEIVTELNDAGDYFPVFGVCLGFEYLFILAAERGDKDDFYYCHDSLPLDFTPYFVESV